MFTKIFKLYIYIHIHTHTHTHTHLEKAEDAKSLQSCPTLCDPIDGSPPGFRVPGILQARTLEWVAISFSNAWKWKEKVKSLSRVRLLDPMDCSPPGSSIHWIFQARVLEWGAIAFSKGRGTRDHIANICWIIEKAREFQKNIYFCFTDYTKPLTVWITTNCGKFLNGNSRPLDLPPEKSLWRSRSNS